MYVCMYGAGDPSTARGEGSMQPSPNHFSHSVFTLLPFLQLVRWHFAYLFFLWLSSKSSGRMPADRFVCLHLKLPEWLFYCFKMFHRFFMLQ